MSTDDGDATPPTAVPKPAPPRPGPPRPGPPRPRPPVAPSAQPTTPPTTSPASAPTTAGSAEFGRVDDEGRVYVRTADGERLVGQVPGETPENALAFYTRRFDELAFEIQLLEQRVAAGNVSPDDASGALKQLAAALPTANAVGDFAALDARIETLTARIAEQRELRRAERAQKIEAARADKERIAGEAEKLAESNDWRDGANRLRDLLEEWKALPRLDKASDDALWRRFSSARTAYTRRRKSHFSDVHAQRDHSRELKEKLVKEAEALSDSTDWGATSAAYRQLMTRWKAAGSAPRGVDDQLWKRFRAAQDVFFSARDAANAAQDAEFAENAATKEALLAEAEALLPVTDLAAAKAAFRAIADKWDAAGKVPRDRVKALEGRMRKVEQAIRGVEDDAWRRSNPEARARAADTVAQLEASIADLTAQRDKAVAAGNQKKAAEATAAIEARQSWLAEAQRALEEFSG
ncbi:MAG: DUF349 domain-containing protein [Nocardioidaceae bacterium]